MRKISQFSRDGGHTGASHNSRETTLSDRDATSDVTDDFRIPIQHIDALQPAYSPLVTSSEHSAVHRLTLPPARSRSCLELPHWCLYAAYALCAVLYAVSLVCTLLYGYYFGRDTALKWLFAFFMSFANSFFVLEPLKVILVALVVAKLSNNIEDCEETSDEAPVLEGNERIKDVKIRPLAGFSLLQAKEEARKVTRMRKMLRNFVTFMLYLMLVMIVNYASYNAHSLLLHRHVNTTFTVPSFDGGDLRYRDVSSYEQYWQWLEQVAAPGLHARELDAQAEAGYVLGRAALRQVRSQAQVCEAKNRLDHFNAEALYDQGCFGTIKSWSEDTRDYGVAWTGPDDNGSAWAHHSNDDVTYHGHMGAYAGNGYVQELGSSYNETLDIIAHLKNNSWLTRATRVVLLEMTSYSVNTPLFAVATFAVEFPVSSSALPSQQVDLLELINHSAERATPYLISEILLFLVFIYLLVVVILALRTERLAYFTSFSNWVQLLLTSLTLASVALYISAVVLCTSAYRAYVDERSDFLSFRQAAYWVQQWKNTNAVLLFVLMLVVSGTTS